MKTPFSCRLAVAALRLPVRSGEGYRPLCGLLVVLLACIGPERAFSQADPTPAATPSAAKTKIDNEAGLPRFSYALTTSPSELLHADAMTFDAFAQ